MAAQLLGDGLDLAGRDALHVHLGQRRHQGLLGALVTFENFGREPAVAILRHAQFELAHARDERAGVVAGAVAEPAPVRSLFPAPSASVISASSISCTTARTNSRSPSGLVAKSSLTAAIAGLPSVLVMAEVLQRESGDLTSPACHDRLSLSAILQNLPHANPDLVARFERSVLKGRPEPSGRPFSFRAEYRRRPAD